MSTPSDSSSSVRIRRRVTSVIEIIMMESAVVVSEPAAIDSLMSSLSEVVISAALTPDMLRVLLQLTDVLAPAVATGDFVGPAEGAPVDDPVAAVGCFVGAEAGNVGATNGAPVGDGPARHESVF